VVEREKYCCYRYRPTKLFFLTWVACHKFYKICILILKLYKSHKWYNFSTSIFFQFNFGIKSSFFYLVVPGWERRERDHWVPVVEREKYRWHRCRPTKHMIFVSNDSIRWGEFILCVFLPLKYVKKIDLSVSWFQFLKWCFGFF
jgi:hypothetical protein